MILSIRNNIAGIIGSLLILLVTPFLSNAQGNNAVLYQSDYQKVTFKTIDEHYAYILEDYLGMFGGTLVKYEINGNELKIEELDTMIVIDSMLFYDSRSFKKDSIMLSFIYRLNEFPTGSLWNNSLEYIINDSIIYRMKAGDNDEFHRVLVPQIEPPYKLEIQAGARSVGPFTVTTSNDVSCKVVVLRTAPTFEFDHGKDLPKKVIIKGKEYHLRHSFEPWE